MAAVALAPTVASAQLNGRQIKGSLTFTGFVDNYWDQGSGAVTIGGPSEFTFTDDFSAIDANWDGSGFTIQQKPLTSAAGANGWVITFTSVDVGLFASLVPNADGFNPGLKSSLVGNTITISWDGGDLPRQYTARFNVVTGTSVVPEPSTYALMATGLAGLVLIRRRRADV